MVPQRQILLSLGPGGGTVRRTGDASEGLYGTVEINDGSGFAGHTSTVEADAAAAPESVPDMSAYSLPDSAVDGSFVANC